MRVVCVLSTGTALVVGNHLTCVYSYTLIGTTQANMTTAYCVILINHTNVGNANLNTLDI